MTFRVGMKVICVWHVPTIHRRSHCFYPEKHGIYTIRDIYVQNGRDLLLLQEVHNPMWEGGEEYGFNSRGFRPIVERKTEISIFTQMLNHSKHGLDA